MITPQIWAWIAIGFAWLWVAIWQWKLVWKAMKIIGKNPKMNTFFLTVTILWLALVESSAIYWLIVAFQILAKDSIDWLQAIWIWLAVWLAWLWVWIWEWELVASAIDTMNKSPDNKNRIMTYMILFLALVESAAIYGLVMSFQMLWKETLDWMSAIWMWLAVWLAWLWVWIWEWLLAKKAMENIGKNFKMANYFLTVTILWIALTESAAIYWLIVAFQILGKETIDWLLTIWVWLSIWLAWLWVWIWEWILVGSAIDAMNNSPRNKNKIMVYMILFLALVESAAIYGLVISFQMLWKETLDWLSAIWMWLAVWLAWLWVWLWEWLLAKKSMENIGKNFKMSSYFLTVTILWIALTESAAIYWLIVAFQILNKEVIDWLITIWVWASIWLAWLWVWIWEWILVGSALDAMNKNPDNKNKIMVYMILFLALVESAAIYGLVVSFQMLWKETLDWLSAVWMWLAVWLAWLWVWVWEWLLAKKSMENIGKNFRMSNYFLTVTILWIALTESAAIYWLIIAFQILGKETLDWLVTVWVWISIWLAWLWVWIWEWVLVGSAIDAMNNSPKNKNKIMVFMILFLALVESAAIYGLVVSFQMLWKGTLDWLSAIWIWLAVWLAWLWVWLWEWLLAKKSMENIGKNFRRANYFLTVTILWIALTESAAIYWLIIGFQMLWKDTLDWLAAIWMWLSVWLAWLWVWLWEWILVTKAIENIGKNFKLSNYFLTVMILWIALTESAAIYWLIVAFQILGKETIDWLLTVWVWLAIWLAWLWVWIWEWILVGSALDAMNNSEKNKNKIMVFMILFLALVESAAIYGLVIAFQMLGSLDLTWLQSIGAWIAVWLAWLWVWLWEWILAKKSLYYIWKKFAMSNYFLTVTILWIALTESAAIYGLVVAFSILGQELSNWIIALWAWLAIGLAWLWAWIWEGYLVWWAFSAMNRNPANKTKSLVFMVLFLALVEVIAIYGLIIAFNVLG